MKLDQIVVSSNISHNHSSGLYVGIISVKDQLELWAETFIIQKHINIEHITSSINPM